MKRNLDFNGEIAVETNFNGYFATKSGKIISIKVKGGQGRQDISRPREHNYKIDKDGYLECLFSENSVRTYRRAHRVIWETFNGEIKDDLTIDHIDGNIKNNDITNLRLLSRKDNTSIATKGKKSPKRFFYDIHINNSPLFEKLDREEIQEKFNLSRKFWYNDKNKLNDFDFIYLDYIFIKRV